LLKVEKLAGQGVLIEKDPSKEVVVAEAQRVVEEQMRKV
jgi:hypothetical protein